MEDEIQQGERGVIYSAMSLWSTYLLFNYLQSIHSILFLKLRQQQRHTLIFCVTFYRSCLQFKH